MSTTWNTGRLGDVCRVVPGYAFKSSDWQTAGIPVIKIKNITGSNSVDLATTDCVPEGLLTPKLQKFVINDGDILVAMTGATAGKVGRVRTSRKLLLNQRVAKIAPVEADPDFIWAVVSSQAYQERFFYLADGAAQPNMSGGQIEGVEIPIPPLPIQRRIAGILSAYDELIENSQRRIKILESMARALYREWFVHFRFPGHESVPRIPSPLGDIPQGWEVKTVPDCVHINPRVAVPRDGEKPFVPMGCLSNDSMHISDIEAREGNSGAKFQNGDTLFARITPCLENGKTGFVQFLPDSQSVGFGSTEFIVLRSRTLTPEFVYLLARNDEFRGVAIKSMSGATGRQRVQEKCFDDLRIAQPPRALLDRFTLIVSPSFQLTYKLHLQIQNLRRTRDLLLPRLMSGLVKLQGEAQ
jgi:type I restriction enzyme S subunit